MHPPILGRPAGDGPRHARATHAASASRQHFAERGPRRYRRRVALLFALLVVPTAATVSDVARHPLAADTSPSLESLGAASPRVSAPLAASGALPGAATPPNTALVTAEAGETIWSVAARTGAAPGVVLRHNRTFALGTARSTPDGAVDTLASGRPLERARTLVVPSTSERAESTTPGEGRPDEAWPLADTPELAALEPVFDRWADHFGVPRDLLKALAWVESDWDNDTRSSGGGIGIGRLQPLRAQYLADHVAGMALDPTVEVDNIALTAAQLRVLLDETPDVRSAVAAHRQGITDTRLSGVDPLLDGYVDAVLALRLRFA